MHIKLYLNHTFMAYKNVNRVENVNSRLKVFSFYSMATLVTYTILTLINCKWFTLFFLRSISLNLNISKTLEQKQQTRWIWQFRRNYSLFFILPILAQTIEHDRERNIHIRFRPIQNDRVHAYVNTLDPSTSNPVPICFNSFTAKFKNVVWDYFHVQYYISF